MNTERIEALVAYLGRQSNDNRAIGRMRIDDAYCAMGHACELYREETGLGHWQPSDSGNGTYFFYHDEDVNPLTPVPLEVLDWYGLPLLESSRIMDFSDKYGLRVVSAYLKTKVRGELNNRIRLEGTTYRIGDNLHWEVEDEHGEGEASD